MDIIFKGSPNRQPRTQKVTKIIIHWFGIGTLESANARFQNPASKASAHYGISKGRIWQWVREEDIAYQAGVWAVNTETIGIEHDATLDHNLAEEDYQLSGKLVAEIAKRHNIPLDRQHIIRHGEVKPTQCPGTIDLDKIISIAKAQSAPALPMRFEAVKRFTDPTVYVVAGDSLFPFGSREAFESAGGNFVKVKQLSDSDFYKYAVLNDTPINLKQP